MAMIGKGASNWSGPSGWADRLSIIGAALKDASPESQGGNLLRVQSMLGGREQEAKKQEFLKALGGKLGPQYADGSPSPTVTRRGMIGAQGALLDPSGAISEATNAMAPGPAEEGPAPYQYTPPVRTSDGLRIDSPELPTLAFQAQQMGIPLTSVIDILKANQPDNALAPDGSVYNRHASNLPSRFATPTTINGWNVDNGAPETRGKYYPKLPDGMQPDGNGGVSNMSGLTAAQAAQEEATTRAKTRGTMLNVPLKGGGSRMMLGADYLVDAGGGGAPGARPGSDLGTSQSPADAAYAGDVAHSASAQYKSISDAGAAANAKIGGYQQLKSLLAGFRGGRLAPTGLELASAANSLGFGMSDKMSNAQAAEAIGNRLLLDMNGGSLGTGFSNADRDFLKGTIPGILQTENGRNTLLDIGIAKAKRDQVVAEKARAWQDRFGRLDTVDSNGKHFQDYLDAWAQANPVWRPHK